jgi:hypothetical protein
MARWHSARTVTVGLPRQRNLTVTEPCWGSYRVYRKYSVRTENAS